MKNEIMKELTRYSLLKKENQGDSPNYSMHRLLQEVVRNKINHEQLWAQHCLKIFMKIYKFDYGNITSRSQFLVLTPHLEALLNVSFSTLLDDENQIEMASLFFEDGLGNYQFGNYPKSLEWSHKALAIHEKVLGTYHPDTASTYNHIAFVYSSQGDYPTALEWFHKSLDIREKVLGTDHPDTKLVCQNIEYISSS